MIKAAFDNKEEEDLLKDIHDQSIPNTSFYNRKIVEIEPGKTLNINANLMPDRKSVV